MTRRNIPTLDLHGCVREEAINLLDQFIIKHNNHEELRVIVGKGSGIIKQTTIDYLEGAKYPWRYEKARGIENPGALIVDMN